MNWVQLWRSHRPQTLNISRPAQQLPSHRGGEAAQLAELQPASFTRGLVERAEVRGVNPPTLNCCAVTSTFNYLRLIRPFNLPCQLRQRSHFPLNSVRRSVSSKGSQVYNCSACFWDWRGIRKLFRFINMFRAADSRWLVSSWLMEWEGKLIYEAARRQTVKVHKELQREGVCRLNAMLSWACVRACAYTSGLNWVPPTFYDNAHSNSSANDSERILCLLAQI